MLKEKLQELLTLRDMRPSELARKAKISQSVISEVLSSKRDNLSLDTLKKISKALGINMLYFMESDTVGPMKILEHLTEEEKAFVVDEFNAPFIKLTARAAKEGLTSEQLGFLIKAVLKHSK